MIEELGKRLDSSGVGNDQGAPGTTSIVVDLDSLDFSAWLFQYAVSSGDVPKDSVLYQTIAAAMLTAYGFR